MTTREAFTEMQSILGTDITLYTTTIHFEDDQYERLQFLIEYIEGRLPVDPDFNPVTNGGVLY